MAELRSVNERYSAFGEVGGAIAPTQPSPAPEA